MKDSNPPPKWQLAEVWGDTADLGHLGWAILIGIVTSISSFLIASGWLKTTVASPELAHAYSLLVGLAGCLLAGTICTFLFKPKRTVVEGEAGDPVWREEVLASLAERDGGLGSLADLPANVVEEMKELKIYDLFAAHSGTICTSPHQENGNKPVWTLAKMEKQS